MFYILKKEYQLTKRKKNTVTQNMNRKRRKSCLRQRRKKPLETTQTRSSGGPTSWICAGSSDGGNHRMLIITPAIASRNEKMLISVPLNHLNGSFSGFILLKLWMGPHVFTKSNEWAKPQVWEEPSLNVAGRKSQVNVKVFNFENEMGFYFIVATNDTKIAGLQSGLAMLKRTIW